MFEASQLCTRHSPCRPVFSAQGPPVRRGEGQSHSLIRETDTKQNCMWGDCIPAGGWCSAGTGPAPSGRDLLGTRSEACCFQNLMVGMRGWWRYRLGLHLGGPRGLVKEPGLDLRAAGSGKGVGQVTQHQAGPPLGAPAPLPRVSGRDTA